MAKMSYFNCLAHVLPKNARCPLDPDELGAYVAIYGLAIDIDEFEDLAREELEDYEFIVDELTDFFLVDPDDEDEETRKLLESLTEESPIVFGTFNTYTSEHGPN